MGFIKRKDKREVRKEAEAIKALCGISLNLSVNFVDKCTFLFGFSIPISKNKKGVVKWQTLF